MSALLDVPVDRAGIRVFLVDDHPIVLEGLLVAFAAAPDIHVAGEAGSAEAALDLLPAAHADVVISDLSLPGADGVELCGRVDVPCVLFSVSGEPATVRKAFQAGARGFLLKDVSFDAVVDAVRAAAEGRRTVDNRLAPYLLQPVEPPLTDTEHEVLSLVADGLSNKRIADTLQWTPGQVKGFLARLRAKLGARTRTEAIALAARRGLL